MKRSGYKTVVVVLVVAGVLSGLAFAQGGGRRGVGLGFGGPERAGGPMQGRGPRMGGGRPMQGPGVRMGAGGPVRGDGLMIGAILRRLDLSNEQKEKVKGILEESKEKAEAARDAVAEAIKGLHEMAAEGDEATIRKAAARVGEAIGEQAVLRVQTMAAIKDVLTDEQKKELDELKEKAKERAEEVRERRSEQGNEDFRDFDRPGWRRSGTGWGSGEGRPWDFREGPRGWRGPGGEGPARFREFPRRWQGPGDEGLRDFREAPRGRRGNW